MTDLPTLICFFLLFGMAVAACAYKVGHSHGHEAGYEAGCADEITRGKPRIIAAKRQAGIIARTLCLSEMNKGAARLSRSN